MQVAIREACGADYAAIGRLFFETIRTVNLRDYTKQQVAAWAPVLWLAEDWRLRLAGQTVFVAAEGGKAASGADLLAGFTSIEAGGHIDFLFVHKDRQRQGIGSALLAAALDLARQWKLPRVFTESSITAKPLFECHGFVVTQTEDVIRHGVTLRRYRMAREM